MFIFAFVSLEWRDIWKKYIKADIKECTAYVFSFQSYSCKYCIKFLIHFKFVFVYAIKKQFSMILLLVAVQFSQHHLLRGLYFPYCMFLPLLTKINWPYKLGYISGISIWFHWSMSLFLFQYHTVLITVSL